MKTYTLNDATEDQVLFIAEQILVDRYLRIGQIFGPGEAKDIFRSKLRSLKNEAFCVMFLDSKNRIIAVETMFQGTINQTILYARPIAVRALELNARALVLAHNHPSGDATPSDEDEKMVIRLRAAMDILGIRVMDSVVVGFDEVVSMTELGMLGEDK